MNLNFLDFEQPIAELLAQIDELKHVSSGVGNNVDLSALRLSPIAFKAFRFLSKISPPESEIQYPHAAFRARSQP